MNEQQFYDQLQFRVWPDGTVQYVDEGYPWPYSYMSDDYSTVWAYNEAEAINKVLGGME